MLKLALKYNDLKESANNSKRYFVSLLTVRYFTNPKLKWDWRAMKIRPMNDKYFRAFYNSLIRRTGKVNDSKAKMDMHFKKFNRLTLSRLIGDSWNFFSKSNISSIDNVGWGGWL